MARSAEADEAFARGERAQRAGRWAEAEASYRAAWQADPRPELAGELGLCELALGRFRDAAEHLRASLVYPETLASAARRRFSEGLTRAEREVASATIAVSRPEADVLIDGRRIGRGQAMYFVYLDPGRHEARARLDGYVDEVYPFEAQRGRESMIGLHLEPRPLPAPRAAPAAPAPAAAAPSPSSGPAAGTVFRIGGLALAAAGVALGAGLLAEASARGEEASTLAAEIRRRGGPSACLYHEHAAACGVLGDSHRARDTLKAAAWASVASAGVVGAVALSSFWWAPAPGTRAVRPVPLATAQGGGVLVVGAW